MGIVNGNGCELQRRGERKNEFGEERQKLFLGHLADSCNIKAAARKAKVAVSTVYMRRQKDPRFRAALAEAQDMAVLTLRAELIRRGLELVRAGAPTETSGETLAGMDARMLLALVTQHERSLGRAAGDIKPQRNDAGEAAARLLSLMGRMRAEHEREAKLARARNAS